VEGGFGLAGWIGIGSVGAGVSCGSSWVEGGLGLAGGLGLPGLLVGSPGGSSWVEGGLGLAGGCWGLFVGGAGWRVD